MLAPTAPAPGLPDQAKIFLFAVGIAATAISMPALLHGGRPHGWIAFAVLAVAAAVAQLFAFHTIRNQVFHTTPLFFIAGVMLLPPQLLILLPLISHVPDWLRKRYAWYIQTFNSSTSRSRSWRRGGRTGWSRARSATAAAAGRPAPRPQ